MKTQIPWENGERLHKQFPLVLFVDDETFLLEGIRRLLERHGRRVMTAHNGREALELLEQGAASMCKILVTDIQMPELSGDELIAMVRQRYPELRIVVLSGEVTEERDRVWQAQGVKAVLRKPVRISHLEQALDRVAE